MHLFNKEILKECFLKLRKNATAGVDDVTIEMYENNLDANLEQLVGRLREKWYKPKPVRRCFIPKNSKGELRPLGIPSVEDKIVQMLLKEILKAIYEPVFRGCSHGFRPERNCHTAVKQLNDAVMRNPVNYVVEVDIHKFFDSVDHIWLLKFLKHRIVDPNILWLVRKFLKAGIMEAGKVQASIKGTPQGGVVSPILANIYLHYVLDLWFDVRFEPESKGFIRLIRYCDDFVMTCESQHDQKRFMMELEERLSKFGLEISKEKTRSIEFGRRVWEQAQRNNRKVPTFDFLGFTHYCGKTRKGSFMMGHKTLKLRLSQKLQNTGNWLKRVRSVLTLKEIMKTVKAKLIGYYNYFGINGNMRCLKQYYQSTIWLIYKWINRRSQKKSKNKKQFFDYLKWNPLPTPRIYHAILY